MQKGTFLLLMGNHAIFALHVGFSECKGSEAEVFLQAPLCLVSCILTCCAVMCCALINITLKPQSVFFVISSWTHVLLSLFVAVILIQDGVILNARDLKDSNRNIFRSDEHYYPRSMVQNSVFKSQQRFDVSSLHCHLGPRWCPGPCCCWEPCLVPWWSYCSQGLCWFLWPVLPPEDHVDVRGLCCCKKPWKRTRSMFPLDCRLMVEKDGHTSLLWQPYPPKVTTYTEGHLRELLKLW